MSQKHTQPHTESKPDLAGAVLGRIEAEHIEPTSRWHFIFSEAAMWFLWVGSIIAGAAAVAVMLYVSTYAGYALYEATHENWVEFALEAAPVLWLFIFVLMAVVAYVNLRHTKRGYRYPVWQILLSSILLSVLGGGVLNAMGAGQVIETALEKTMPMYHSFADMEQKWWQKPEAGLLVGTFVARDETTNLLTFLDVHDHMWHLKFDELKDFELDLLVSGELVKIMGMQATSTPGLFYSCAVFPWMHGKPVRLAEMREERREFLDKMHNFKARVQQQLVRAEQQLFGTSTLNGELEPMGLCPTMPLLKKMP